jgi:hypothetical protein
MSADWSLPHKHTVDKKQSLLLFIEVGFDSKHSSSDLSYSLGYRKSGKALLHHNLEDGHNFL